jgi:glycerol-3-phosphate acyltransferase PlsY
VTRLAFIAGACVIGAYLLGSVPTAYLRSRRRIRRDLRRLDTRRGSLEMQLRLLLAGVAHDPDEPPPGVDLVAAVLDTAKVLLAATVAWHVVARYSPGHGHVRHVSLGAVAFTSNQVLLGQQSAGLWAGLAAVAGHLAPPWLRARSGQGQAPVLALALVYCPVGFSVAVFGFFASLAALRRVPRAVIVSVGCFVAYAWLAWAFDWRASWGVPNGPELTLWAAGVAAVVAARVWPEAAW